MSVFNFNMLSRAIKRTLITLYFWALQETANIGCIFFLTHQPVNWIQYFFFYLAYLFEHKRLESWFMLEFLSSNVRYPMLITTPKRKKASSTPYELFAQSKMDELDPTNHKTIESLWPDNENRTNYSQGTMISHRFLSKMSSRKVYLHAMEGWIKWHPQSPVKKFQVGHTMSTMHFSPSRITLLRVGI